ncbi:MAG TPA: hypothetical protein VK066_27525 [Chloroflexota bacterium]|nr:hypothetical protein [Chloroflexota bacterium]
MRRVPWLGVLLLAAWCVGLVSRPVPVAAQTGTSPQGIVTSLSSAVDAIQARLDAGDTAGALAAYDAFENVWFGVEDVVRAVSGSTYRDIEQAMADLRNALPASGSNPDAARAAIAALRGQFATFATQAGVTPPAVAAASAGPPAAPAASASPPAAASPAPAASTAPSVEECARYAGQAAQPYFDYAQALLGNAPLPGIPPAQAVTPQYAYGPGPVPGTAAIGPYRPIYPYPGRYGPGAFFGGVGATNPNSQLAAPGLVNAFQAGGQLPILPNGALAPLAPSDVIALGANQAAEAGNTIALGGLQQSVVANQLGYSDLRYNWVQTYLQMSEQARNLALLHCGRIP